MRAPFLLIASFLAATSAVFPQKSGFTDIEVPYVPTPNKIVTEMLTLAKVTKDDVVYDLGCGDGRIVVAAAKLGARGVGIDIDPARIAESNANAKSAGVADRVKFILGDIFDPSVKISDATVVTLF